MGETRAALVQGDIIAGKYEVVEVLGQGGMGVVVAAVHRQFDQCFAIKLLLPDLVAQPGAISRFKREARAAGALRSPHAVRVFDVDTTSDGTPYIVMELLEGHDLAAEAAARGQLPLAELVDWIIEVCSAIDEAHARGIVHRDLKPSNIFIVQEGDGRIAKVFDFGISRAVNASDRTTSADASFGTLHYMSPELVRGESKIDGRSDIWSLGVVLYRLLANRFPFSCENPGQLAIAIATEPPVGLDIYRHDLPAAFVTSVMRALARRPEDRFATAGELAEALAPFGTGRKPRMSRSTRIRVARPLESIRPAPVQPVSAPNEPSEPASPEDGAIRFRPRWLAIGLAAFCLGGILDGRASATPEASSSNLAPPPAAVSEATVPANDAALSDAQTLRRRSRALRP